MHRRNCGRCRALARDAYRNDRSHYRDALIALGPSHNPYPAVTDERGTPELAARELSSLLEPFAEDLAVTRISDFFRLAWVARSHAVLTQASVAGPLARAAPPRRSAQSVPPSIRVDRHERACPMQAGRSCCRR